MHDFDTLRTQMNFSFFFMKISKVILPVRSRSLTMVVTQSSPTVQGNVCLVIQMEYKHNTQDETKLHSAWTHSWVLECNWLLNCLSGLWHNFNLCQLANSENSWARFENSHELGSFPAGKQKLSCSQTERF